MNDEQLELKIVDIQLIITIIIVVTVVTSAITGYNLHLKFSGKKTFLTDEQIKKIAIISKSIILIVSLAAIILSIENLKIVKKKDKDLLSAYLEVASAVLVSVSAFLILVSVLRNSQDLFIDVENPEV